MTEKELLYIDDVLGHIENAEEFVKMHEEDLESEEFKDVLNKLSSLNKDCYKKFYKQIEK